MLIKSFLMVPMFLLTTGSVFCMEPEQSFPPDVTKFIEERMPCDHFRGEPRNFDESYIRANGKQAEIEQAERADFLEKMKKKTCDQMDKRLRNLNKKYSGNKFIADKLSEYDYFDIGSGYVFMHKNFPNGKLIEQKLVAKGFMSYDVRLMEGKDWLGRNWDDPLPSKLTIQIGSEVDVFAAQLAIETILEYGPKDMGVVVLPKNDGALSLSMLVGRNLIGNNHVYRGRDIQALLSPNLTRGDFDKFAKQALPDLSAPCAREMMSCNGIKDGCVSLRIDFDMPPKINDKYNLALYEKLQAAAIPFSNIGHSPPAAPFNCVGYRRELNGTEEGAKCIARLLGLEFRSEGCNVEDKPYTVKIY